MLRGVGRGVGLRRRNPEKLNEEGQNARRRRLDRRAGGRCRGNSGPGGSRSRDRASGHQASNERLLLDTDHGPVVLQTLLLIGPLDARLGNHTA